VVPRPADRYASFFLLACGLWLVACCWGRNDGSATHWGSCLFLGFLACCLRLLLGSWPAIARHSPP